MIYLKEQVSYTERMGLLINVTIYYNDGIITHKAYYNNGIRINNNDNT
jgi:hypothetical protein